jgi:hypothetical protein
MKLTKITVGAGLMGLALSANAQLAFTIEGPGVQSTTVSGVITENFDSRALGAFSGATPVGTFSAGGTIFAADQFGGANTSQFMRPQTAPVMLTMPAPQNYFGVWWSAGDANNFLEFFDGATSLGVYNVGTIIPFLSSSYYGNPNPPAGRNLGEPYAYLNFTTTGSEHITAVKFSGGNFEFDNISITEEKITPPGNSVPDGGATIGLLGAGMLGLAALRRKSRA